MAPQAAAQAAYRELLRKRPASYNNRILVEVLPRLFPLEKIRRLAPTEAVHEIDLPQSFLKEHKRLIMPNPVLRIPGCVVTKQSVHVPENADITVNAENSPRRRLAPKSGTTKALTVRITANGTAQPQETKSELQGRVFGVGPDAEAGTVFTQYKKCSFGAQDIQPATAGIGVQSGVVDIASCDILGDRPDYSRNGTPAGH
jgi:hypothetical protein